MAMISKEQLKALQNGSDVRGVAVDGVEGQPVTLPGEAVCRIARAFALWLSKKTGKPTRTLRIGVGHDSRISSPALCTEALAGMAAEGVAVHHCGLASTPSMFMSTLFPETTFDGAIMITASHLPYNRNGLKFFDAQGGLDKADISALLDVAAALSPAESTTPAPSLALIPLYAAYLCGKIREGVNAADYDRPLTGLHIVVDAGNGAGGFFVDQVLRPLGADVSGSQFLDPDGMFPNHIPNPENKQAMEAIRSATLANKADLGIIFDTDVDRMSAVLADGSEVNRDAIIAMMAAILAPDYPGSTIVTDSVTSDKLTLFLEDTLGLHHHRFKRGYKNVINECKRLNDAGVVSPLAIETSGHGALSENFYLDDGAYLAVKLLIAAANAKKQNRRVDSLIEALPASFESREYRMKLQGEGFGAYGEEILSVFEARAKAQGVAVSPNSYEGVRISFADDALQGWALLRLSLHDPLMPLNLEGNRPGDCEKILVVVRRLLEGFDKLDLSCLD